MKRNRPQKPVARKVLNLFVDSVSRVDFYRKLPKTVAWIQQNYENKSSYKGAFQFFRYHAVSSFTSATMLPAAVPKRQPKVSKLPAQSRTKATSLFRVFRL